MKMSIIMQKKFFTIKRKKSFRTRYDIIGSPTNILSRAGARNKERVSGGSFRSLFQLYIQAEKQNLKLLYISKTSTNGKQKYIPKSQANKHLERITNKALDSKNGRLARVAKILRSAGSMKQSANQSFLNNFAQKIFTEWAPAIVPKARGKWLAQLNLQAKEAFWKTLSRSSSMTVSEKHKAWMQLPKDKKKTYYNIAKSQMSNENINIPKKENSSKPKGFTIEDWLPERYRDIWREEQEKARKKDEADAKRRQREKEQDERAAQAIAEARELRESLDKNKANRK